MLFVVKYALHLLILPPGCLIVLGFAGLALARRRPRLGHGVVALTLTALWVLSMPSVGAYLMRAVQTDPALDLARPVDAGAVVILGGGAQCCALEYDGRAVPGKITLQRLAYGAYVAHRLGLPVLVTGAPIEAEAMSAALHRHFGIDARWIDSTATDTYDNARHSALLLARDSVNSIVLVTSAAHLRRAKHEFADAGLRVTPAPTDLDPLPTSQLDRPPLGLLPTLHGLEGSSTALGEMIGEAMRPAMRRVPQALNGA